MGSMWIKIERSTVDVTDEPFGGNAGDQVYHSYPRKMSLHSNQKYTSIHVYGALYIFICLQVLFVFELWLSIIWSYMKGRL